MTLLLSAWENTGKRCIRPRWHLAQALEGECLARASGACAKEKSSAVSRAVNNLTDQPVPWILIQKPH